MKTIEAVDEICWFLLLNYFLFIFASESWSFEFQITGRIWNEHKNGFLMWQKLLISMTKHICSSSNKTNLIATLKILIIVSFLKGFAYHYSIQRRILVSNFHEVSNQFYSFQLSFYARWSKFEWHWIQNVLCFDVKIILWGVIW